MGFYEVAQEQFEKYDAEIRAYLEAYSNGVNAYILNRRPARLGMEFFLLELQGVDFQIEPWRKIEYHPSLWERSAVEQASRRPLVLKPGR